jgi:hypothetical protein
MSMSVLRNPSDVPDALASGTYVTDETHLYRVIGPFDGSMAILMVEDCQTLGVILVETVRVGVLRRVTPSAH